MLISSRDRKNLVEKDKRRLLIIYPMVYWKALELCENIELFPTVSQSMGINISYFILNLLHLKTQKFVLEIWGKNCLWEILG